MLNFNILKDIFKVLLLILAVAPAAAASDEAPVLAGTWVSVLPPVLAIVLALTLRRVIPALFAGIWLGAWIINGLSLGGLWHGLLETFQRYIHAALADGDHATVILFSMMIGGMVGIISRNGGMQGIVNRIVAFADSVRHASLATAAMGLAIFFDDYANTLVVGNTMRPVTDAKHISRAKLAYIVDSTAAPVACIALVTTWIGYEVGLIGDAIAGLSGLDTEAYLLFLHTIPYSFYPVLAIAFVLMVAWSGLDFGPMLRAEREARAHGVHDDLHLEAEQDPDFRPVEPAPGKPQRALNAIIPVAVLVLGVMVGLYVTGRGSLDSPDPTLREIIGAADSYKALMWASFLGVLTAAAMTLVQRILDVEEVINAWYQGLRSMLMALIILVLAWSLGEITEILATADFLVAVLGDSLPPFTLPALIFVLAALTAFATGSSWGAMGILIPLTVPLTWAVMQAQGLTSADDMHLLYSAIASVLAGSVWGDHCSPISDTTILSSLASGCNHIEHVRTQLPYAVLVGLTGILAGSLPVAMGMPWWLGLAIGLVLLAIALKLLGKPSG
ncbi:MAG: Na+/H+ antiporter NhaC family protein [Xanthomonadales bacterium]|nr:Na+/H+ antiporter NhaC family protein [Xanthomonadales bacterium]NIN59859.1 Na+/H+ antiporter NhaC family protein [Xanthomonadales bacterium]NIN75233.1 Na+/H+ antiporter NhaC family protein [Xanthomonadales bacterium]NIO13475.1 Na+/H+ antiporter NhaC family protein [Xanthomonadales bacterium]NIP12252.1 Na+/H+ antiporter NhaC family protein [Xanthomonadales bacterium]